MVASPIVLHETKKKSGKGKQKHVKTQNNFVEGNHLAEGEGGVVAPPLVLDLLATLVWDE